MSFLLLHIIYQITIHSLVAGNSIASNFNCEYTAAIVVNSLRVATFILYTEIKKIPHGSRIQEAGMEFIDWVVFCCSCLLETFKKDMQEASYSFLEKGID